MILSGKINLGIDCREFEKGRVTGIGRYLKQLLDYISRSDKINVYCYGNQKTDFRKLPSISHSRKIAERVTIIWDQFQLPKALHKDQCRLLITPYFKAPYLTKSGVILIANDLIPIKNLYFRLFFKLSLKKATTIIAISKTTLHDLIGFYPEISNKCHVVYLAIDDIFFNAKVNLSDCLKKYKLKAPYVLYVGNANKHKNLPALIRAFEKVRNYTLVLCGIPPSHQNSFVSLAKSVGNIDLKILPNIEDLELAALYRGAVCTVFPSLKEGFGLPPLEAMASGAPVVASDINCFKEVLGDAALFVNGSDPDKIAEGILKMLSNKKLRDEYVQKGRERALLFTTESMVENFESVFEKTVKKMDCVQ